MDKKVARASAGGGAWVADHRGCRATSRQVLRCLRQVAMLWPYLLAVIAVAIQLWRGSQLGYQPVWDEVYYSLPEQHEHTAILSTIIYGHGVQIARITSSIGYGLYLVIMGREAKTQGYNGVAGVLLMAADYRIYTLGHIGTPHMLAIAIMMLLLKSRNWIASLAIILVAGSIHPLATIALPWIITWSKCPGKPLIKATVAAIVAAATILAVSLVRVVYWHHFAIAIPIAAILAREVANELHTRYTTSATAGWRSPGAGA